MVQSIQLSVMIHDAVFSITRSVAVKEFMVGGPSLRVLTAAPAKKQLKIYSLSFRMIFRLRRPFTFPFSRY